MIVTLRTTDCGCPVEPFAGETRVAPGGRLKSILSAVEVLVAFSFPLIYSLFAQDFPHLAVPYFLLMIIVTPGLLFLVCWWRSRDIAKASN